VLGLAKAELGDLELEAVEVESVLLRKIEPAAFEVNIALRVDGEFFDVEGGPFQAAEERGELAAQLGSEKAILDLEGEAGEGHPEEILFLEGDQAELGSDAGRLSRGKRD